MPMRISLEVGHLGGKLIESVPEESAWIVTKPLTDGHLRIRWGWSAGDGDWWFGPDRSQDTVLIPWFTPPCLTFSVTEVISTLVGIVAYSNETFRESVFILRMLCGQVSERSEEETGTH